MDLQTIQTLLKIHSVKKIKKAVEQELPWFAEKYTKPQTVVEHPCASPLAKFQELLYTNRNDEISQPCNMSPSELSRLCVDRWMSDDRMLWMTKILNNLQTDTYCVYLNGMINKDPRKLRRFSKTILPRPLNQLLFVLNVGASHGKTFLGTDEHIGCHWTLCVVDLNVKRIIYGDSLGWPIPEGLVDKVKGYITAATKEDGSDYSVTMCHDSNSISPLTSSHICNQKCVQLYPLQTCSSICGIVVIIMAALACLRPVVFNRMLIQDSNVTKELPYFFLKNPSGFSKYLRRSVIAWVAENEININYVLPQQFAALLSDPGPSTDQFLPDALTVPKLDLSTMANQSKKKALLVSINSFGLKSLSENSQRSTYMLRCSIMGKLLVTIKSKLF